MSSLLGRDITRTEWDGIENNLCEYLKVYMPNIDSHKLSDELSFAICNGNIIKFNDACASNNLNQDTILTVADSTK